VCDAAKQFALLFCVLLLGGVWAWRKHSKLLLRHDTAAATVLHAAVIC
jgi:hypothetical protein